MTSTKLVITSVEKNKMNGRYHVYIDGSYSFSVSEENYLALNLYEEREITDAEVNNIRDIVNYREAKSDGIRYLSLKLRCEKEIGDKLKQDGYDDDIVYRVIDELKSMGYLNDRIYTQKYIFDRSKLKPKSKKMLKLELIHKGVSEDIIDEALDNWEIDEEALAENLVRRKYGKYDLNDEKIIRKIHAFLNHRGFEFNQIVKTIDSIKKQM